MWTRLSLCFVAISLFGCAASGGVYMVGADTYRATTTAIAIFGGGAIAKDETYRSASAFCAMQRKQMTVIDDTSGGQFPQGSANVTFRCTAAPNR